jgi:hypothetical protein
LSRGQHAFTYLELVHLRGDQIENDETAKEMYKNGVLFAEGQSNGFDGILKILDNPIAVASKRAFEDVQYIRNGLAQAMDQLDSDDELFGYETSSKVNGVYFTRKIEDLEYSKYDWKELFIAYLRWNTQLRIDTHWEKVDETIVAREPTRYSQKDIDNKVNYHCLVKKGKVENNKDYYFWGRDQYTAVNITKRMNAIQDFIDNNIEEWKKEGYIA